MSYDRRKVELMECDCVTYIGDLGNIISYPELTVHCETKDRQMRCEICGKIKE